MRFHLVAVVLTAFTLAACESTPTDTGTQTGAAATPVRTPTTPVEVPQVAARPKPGMVPGSLEHFRSVGDRVFFDFDKYDVKPQGRQTLEAQAIFLKQWQNVTLTIQGHADERGTREYNLALGERRANSVKNYLVSLGIDARRIKTISYGKEVPFDPRHNEEAWALNRRGVSEPDRGTLVSSTN